MTDTKKNTLTILAVVLTIAVIFSACTSIFTAKAVYDLRAEAKAQTETQEDMGLSFWTSMKLSPPCPSLRLIVRATPTD